ncbi:hypothetical protein [Aureibacter tunicatorum]|uniref:Uncharacterized protein n=1 Tax=Aureibacter tunicatorum TaxID=866807 RepID=A0AAE3XJQ6_9BACT|nr:hypothetical protein [Aureibacter tunicatorum]MDR6237359.1 hypothetical protein [Aureibacter tunicatorum]BDD06350.1 hypothetical protein AUTU_38330 [Aureibacter tunicatorum]
MPEFAEREKKKEDRRAAWEGPVVKESGFVEPRKAPPLVADGTIYLSKQDRAFFFKAVSGQGIYGQMDRLGISDIDSFIAATSYQGYDSETGKITDGYAQTRYIYKGEAISLSREFVDSKPIIQQFPYLDGPFVQPKAYTPGTGVEEHIKLNEEILRRQRAENKANALLSNQNNVTEEEDEKLRYDYQEVNRLVTKHLVDNNERTGSFDIQITLDLGFSKVLYLFLKLGAGAGLAVGDARGFSSYTKMFIGAEGGVDAGVFKTGVEYTHEWKSSDSYNSLDQYLSFLHYKVWDTLYSMDLADESEVEKFRNSNAEHLDKGYVKNNVQTDNLSFHIGFDAEEYGKATGMNSSVPDITFSAGSSESTYTREKSDEADRHKLDDNDLVRHLDMSFSELDEHQEKVGKYKKVNSIDRSKDIETDTWVKLAIGGLGELALSYQTVGNNSNNDNNGEYINLSFSLDSKYATYGFVSLFVKSIFVDPEMVSSIGQFAAGLNHFTGGGKIVAGQIATVLGNIVKKVFPSFQNGLVSFLKKLKASEALSTNSSSSLDVNAEWNFVNDGGYKLQYARLNSGFETSEEAQIQHPTGLTGKVGLEVGGQMSEGEYWATDTLTYVSTIYNACMGESESDEEKEMKVLAYDANLPEKYWEARIKGRDYHKIADGVGWNSMRAKHMGELKTLCFNFFDPIFDPKNRNAKSWTDIDLVTVNNDFMVQFFAREPNLIFKKDLLESDKSQIKKSGMWLRKYFQNLLVPYSKGLIKSEAEVNDTQKVAIGSDPILISDFEKHVLFNLYIKREEYSFEYWNKS